jgi:hypothetical protein
VIGGCARTVIRAASPCYTPIDTLDFDVINGRNITDENAVWITVGMHVRFPVAK